MAIAESAVTGSNEHSIAHTHQSIGVEYVEMNARCDANPERLERLLAHRTLYFAV